MSREKNHSRGGCSDLNQAGRDGDSPLHVCVQKGYREMLEVLLRAGDTQTRDGQQQTAVMLLDDMRVPGREDMRRLLTSAESSQQQQRQQQRQQQQLQQQQQQQSDSQQARR